MFTGLIEEVGVIKKILAREGALCFTLAAEEILQDLKIDDSIALNGVCLTVTKTTGTEFQVEAVEETLRKTTLGELRTGAKLNLERAMKFSDRMGGHFVQGHVDGVGEVTAIQPQKGGTLLSVKLPDSLLRYVISEGSIAIDGVSLTVARLRENEITISLIPHTLEKTTLGNLNVGDEVNIEVDLLGKYIERLLAKNQVSKLSETWLQEMGYE